MRYVTSEHLKNVANENMGEEMVVSKYELVMLIAKRAKQIAEEVAVEDENRVYEEDEKIVIRKTISEAIDELESNELDIYKEVVNK